MNYMLRNKLEMTEYQIQFFYKPGAKFQSVIEDVENLTKNFTLKDHVIIMAGSNNFSKSSDIPRFKELWNRLKLCPDTNFSFVGVPYGTQSQKRYLYKFNKNLERFIYKLNTCLPGQFSFINVSVNRENITKNKLCSLICNKINLGNNPLPKNLIIINVNQNISQTTENNLYSHESQRISETNNLNTDIFKITVTESHEPEKNQNENSVIEDAVIEKNKCSLGKNPSPVESIFLTPCLSQMSLT